MLKYLAIGEIDLIREQTDRDKKKGNKSNMMAFHKCGSKMGGSLSGESIKILEMFTGYVMFRKFSYFPSTRTGIPIVSCPPPQWIPVLTGGVFQYIDRSAISGTLFEKGSEVSSIFVEIASVIPAI